MQGFCPYSPRGRIYYSVKSNTVIRVGYETQITNHIFDFGPFIKTDISKNFPLERIKLDEHSIRNDLDNYETKITPTFVFFKEKEEIGRIIGYSSAEMFWWQVDEILDRD